MLKLNGEIITISSFPDGTMLIKQNPPEDGYAKIEWYYECDRETLALIYLANHLKANGVETIDLFMPYIPNARQDRVKTKEDVFTLKYFAGLINSLPFHKVTVLDPHSSVSEALIDRIEILRPAPYIEYALLAIEQAEGEKPSAFYPDEGASKRYSGQIPLPYAFGIKKRDWKTGQILGLDASGDTDAINGKNVLIIDDICSRGGTFFHSARKLHELGAKNIYLYVTHCENTIFEGEVLTCGLIKKVFTTESLQTKPHDKIEIIHL
ncbi:MAG: ribose-phosphate pyrophosphokinase [Clostridia bacterium]|nr:ribose-phosphate pyrophosphokinase [Clostridia bacterium]